MFAVYPFVWYRGEAYWNLRTTDPVQPFRTESPNFIQKSTSGYGYQASLGLTYAIMEKIELTAGYRYLYLYAKDGTDTTYFADGSVGTSNLDWTTVTRQGVYAEVLYKF
jgi:opacity protein-like surface antigen